ncbi:uncharacterized protein STEHIDRAFT_59242 [Stereum hirsutum FP-91666 SS1]|uniref:uncharacterized protein n=1 Tax=Stereum hirsutum (strain FP-91666) TaxID=721885 RepID=UPI000444962F|nr:uncharacterized protein STEHIDRAFT_59242 [Stereum hirsutum FP-91666 SS1]EIM85226.1 hypothetical protein STEHIDRAFT_59242 [Stereum hirsutum FP-91666 SS1]
MSPPSPHSSFKPLNHNISQIRAVIPPRLFERDTRTSLFYLVRDLIQILVLGFGIYWFDSLLAEEGKGAGWWVLRSLLWAGYWWFQGLALTGLWVLGHECGHAAFSPSQPLNDALGFVIHTALWTPYFSWSISHHRHHANHGSMERDEVYVPKTRSDLGIPPEPRPQSDGHASTTSPINYAEYFEDTPLYTLAMLLRQQLFAFPVYLLWNVSGQKGYPNWTNHFDPRSILFRPSQFWAVIVSDLGIGTMVLLMVKLYKTFGGWNVLWYYGIPWLGVTHWFVMITYLHHTTPYIPHYRAGAWTFVRGAAATVDRDFLGWQGRWFLHDVAHFHVIHHFFPKLPWYNADLATFHLKALLGDAYLYSDEPVFRALWRSYVGCQFVDDEGDVLFYRDRRGRFGAGRTELESVKVE